VVRKVGRRVCSGLRLESIQLIPNFIPVIGQLDDVLMVSLGIRLLRRWVPPEFFGTVTHATSRSAEPKGS